MIIFLTTVIIVSVTKSKVVKNLIKTITFDFGGVLYFYDDRPLMTELASRSNAGYDMVAEALGDSNLDRAHFKGELDAETLLDLLRDKIDLSMTRSELSEAYSRCVTPNEELFELIESLYGRYSLQLFSDTPRLLYEDFMTQMPVYDYFSATTLSFEIGALKDSPEGYRDMIKKSNHKPGEIVFIDDVEEHAKTANRMGINGIQYVNTQELLKELRRLNVDFVHSPST